MKTTHPKKTRTIITFLICAGLATSLMSGCASKTPSYSKSRKGNYSDPTLAPYVIKNITYYPIADATGFKEKGIASWYGDYFHGRPTSNGEHYDMYGMTAAHKILPMNTLLRVRNLDNGKETVVRVNDRGPFVEGRVIDLSFTAAQKLDIVGPGTSRVEIVALPPDKKHNQLLLAAAPPKTKPQAIKPRRKPEKSTEKEFYVQVGNYNELDNALKLKKRFTDAGHAALIQKKGDPTQPSYLVHVFAGRELAVAKQAEAALVQNGYSEASLVIR